jgi:mono/diheme cytochrome c family protein
MKFFGTALLFSVVAAFSLSVNSAPVQSGAQIWRSNCAACHGADGRGSTKIKGHVPDFTSLLFAETSTRKQMLLNVRDGIKDTLMPSFRDTLSYPDIISVIDYARDSFISVNVHGEEYSEGKKVFADNCSVCHGDHGQGAVWTSAGLFPKPANFTDPIKQKELTKTRMIFSVTNGRPETAMVSWKTRLTEQQISAVVSYIRAGIMKVSDRETTFGDEMGVAQDKKDPFLSDKNFNTTEVATPLSKKGVMVEDNPTGNDPFLTSRSYQVNEDPNIGQDDIFSGQAHDHDSHMGKKLNLLDPLPNDLKGDYAQGRKLYQETCFSCHGLKGDGQGPRSYFIFPKPRNFTHSAARASFSRAHIYERIRTGMVGSEMPAWGQVLSEQQIANVAEYVFMSFISQEKPETGIKEN